MEKLTSLQRENLRYRKKRMEQKARRLELLLSGRGESLLALVRTPGGRYSESRTQGLKKQLLQGQELPGLDREFLDSFLYCALRLSERGPALLQGPGFEWSIDGTFQDLPGLAVTIDPWGDRYDRWYQDFFSGNCQSAAFALMDSLYEKFSGEPIERALALLLPEVSAKALSRYRPEPESTQEPEEWEEEFLPAGFDEEEWEKLEQDKTLEYAAWEKNFPAKDRFCQAYLLCRKRYFETENCRGLSAGVEQAVDEYLCCAGLSNYLADRTFFAVYGLLERSEKQARALQREVR